MRWVNCLQLIHHVNIFTVNKYWKCQRTLCLGLNDIYNVMVSVNITLKNSRKARKTKKKKKKKKRTTHLPVSVKIVLSQTKKSQSTALINPMTSNRKTLWAVKTYYKTRLRIYLDPGVA